jgi:hypothetical protein
LITRIYLEPASGRVSAKDRARSRRAALDHQRQLMAKRRSDYEVQLEVDLRVVRWASQNLEARHLEYEAARADYQVLVRELTSQGRLSVPDAWPD